MADLYIKKFTKRRINFFNNTLIISRYLKKIENGTYVSSKSKWGIHLYKFENNEFVYYGELEVPIQDNNNQLSHHVTIGRQISTSNNKLSWYVARNLYNGISDYGAVYIYDFENGVANNKILTTDNSGVHIVNVDISGSFKVNGKDVKILDDYNDISSGRVDAIGDITVNKPTYGWGGNLTFTDVSDISLNSGWQYNTIEITEDGTHMLLTAPTSQGQFESNDNVYAYSIYKYNSTTKKWDYIKKHLQHTSPSNTSTKDYTVRSGAVISNHYLIHSFIYTSHGNSTLLTVSWIITTSG